MLIVIYGNLMVIDCDSMDINGDLWWFNGDLMVI
jgi:hypothetical protein